MVVPRPSDGSGMSMRSWEPRLTSGSALAKRSYVGTLRVVRRALRPTGLLDRPVPDRAHRTRHWLRSLTAIHDVDALIALGVPWWTYGAIDEVESFLLTRVQPRVFEYGSGASTVWLAQRAAHVTSVEHDSAWCEVLRTRLIGYDNVAVRLVPPDPQPDPTSVFLSEKPGYRGRTFRSYVEFIRDSDDVFDLIVIDGRARPACLHEATSHLAAGGMIVFDNAKRSRYRAAIAQAGLHVTEHRGLVPSLPVPDVTSILRGAG